MKLKNNILLLDSNDAKILANELHRAAEEAEDHGWMHSFSINLELDADDKNEWNRYLRFLVKKAKEQVEERVEEESENN